MGGLVFFIFWGLDPFHSNGVNWVFRIPHHPKSYKDPTELEGKALCQGEECHTPALGFMQNPDTVQMLCLLCWSNLVGISTHRPLKALTL